MGTGSSIGIRRVAKAPPSAAERADWHRRASGLYEELRRPATGLIRRAYGAAFAEDVIDDLYSSAWLGTLRALERRHAELDDDEIRSYLLTAVAEPREQGAPPATAQAGRADRGRRCGCRRSSDP